MGAADFSPGTSSVHNERRYYIRLLGTGASVPTIEVGPGVTISRVSAGLNRLTWTPGPGTFIGFQSSLGAATTSDVKNFSVVRDTYDTTNHQLDIALYNASGTITDLAANCYIDLIVTFTEGTP